MKSMALKWFDANADSVECSFCDGSIDRLKKPVIVYDRNNETLARFHPDCYESYFYSANKYEELADGVDWVVPVVRRFWRW